MIALIIIVLSVLVSGLRWALEKRRAGAEGGTPSRSVAIHALTDAALVVVLAVGGGNWAAGHLPGWLVLAILPWLFDIAGLIGAGRRRAGLARAAGTALIWRAVLAVAAVFWLVPFWPLVWLLWAMGVMTRPWIGGGDDVLAWLRPRPALPSAVAADVTARLRQWGLARVRVVAARPDQAGGHRPNARAVGLGPWAMVELTQGLLDLLTSAQLAAVVAHEAGHLRYGHRGLWLAGTVMLGAGVIGAMSLCASSAADPVAALAAWVMLRPMALFCLRPLAAWVRRSWEYQADAYAARRVSPQSLSHTLDVIHAATGAADGGSRLYQWCCGFHPFPAQRRRRLRDLADRSIPAAGPGLAGD